MTRKNDSNIRYKKQYYELKTDPLFPFVLTVFVVLLFSSFYLFVNQARGLFLSDLTSHINTAIRGEGYSINSLIMRISYKLAGHYGVAAYLSITVFGTSILSGIYFYQCHELSSINNKLQWPWVCLIGVASLFLCGIYIPNVYPLFYLYHDYTGVGTASSICAQPWHNSTYILMRPFGLITLIYFFRIQSHYLEEGIKLKEWIYFMIALMLTNAAKPNFFIAFAPAMLVFLIIDLIRTKGRGLRRIILFGTAVLCSIPVLLFQMDDLFSNKAVTDPSLSNGVKITTEVFKRIWNEGTILPLLVTGLMFFFLVTVFCIKYGEMKKHVIFGWLMLLIAMLESWFIIETGPRAGAGNFGWGVPFCAFSLTIMCVERLMALKKQLSHSIFMMILSPLVLMLITGVAYFAHLLGGGSFIS